MKPCPRLTEKQVKELQLFLRSHGPTATELKRAQVVLLIDKKELIEKINFITGYHRRQIFELRRRYLERGLEGLRSRKKTKRSLLTKSQLKEIIRILRTKTPQDLDYKSLFWTTAILADYIKRIYGIKYRSKTSYYLVFEAAKFSYHKPGRVYEKRNEKEVKRWKRETRPILQKAWRDKKTVVLAEDEMILSTQTTFQKIWLPANHYPKIEISNTKKNRSVYGFLNLKTGRQHAFKTEKQNMFITAEILKKVRKIYPKKKILLLWDGPGWHRGSAVQEAAGEDGNITTIHFPPYSPELNPQEKVWKEGRDKITHNKFIQNIDKATDEFAAYLNRTKFPYSLLGFSAKT